MMRQDRFTEGAQEDRRAEGCEATSDQTTLREVAEKIKRDSTDAAFHAEVLAVPREEIWSELHAGVFLTSMYKPPSYATRVTDLVVDLLRDETHEVEDLWSRISMQDLEDVTAFNLLLDEILWQPPALTGTRRFSITMLEGTVAGWAGVIGARTAHHPDRTPIVMKFAARMKGWRLAPPSLSANQAERRAADIREGLALPLISAHLVDRVTRSLVAHALPPDREALRQILREMSREHMEILTILARASDEMIGKSIGDRGSRRFLSMLVSHAAYRGLLVGYRAYRQ